MAQAGTGAEGESVSAAIPTFGAYLRARRKGARLSLYQVGRAIGMDARHLSRVERGKARSPMAPEHLPTLARTIVGFDEARAGRLLRGEVEVPAKRPTMADVVARLEALEKRATFAPPTPPLPENEAMREALGRALFALYIYAPHDRGTGGCLYDIVKAISPDAAAMLDETDARTVHQQMFGEE